MSKFAINTTISTKTSSFNEVNIEISKIKATIGLLLPKLESSMRNAFIEDLINSGLKEEAEIYSAFLPPSKTE